MGEAGKRRRDRTSGAGTMRQAIGHRGRDVDEGGTAAGAPPSVTYDAANRITAWGGQPFLYDANGNLVSVGA